MPAALTTLNSSQVEILLEAAKSAGIVDRKELANFMGQMQVESQGFTRMHENLSYSGERLLALFPGRNGMKRLDDARAVVSGGEASIAEAIYGGKWGESNLGNKPASGDSLAYCGRGFIDVTGRDNYAHYGKVLGLDLVSHPQLAAEPKNAAAIAVQYWKERVVARGHQTDVNDATNDITGNKRGHHESFPKRNAAATEWGEKLGLITDKHHPGHALYQQALNKLDKYNADHNVKLDPQSTRNAAAFLAVEAHQHGLKRIDGVQPGTDGGRLFAVQGTPGTVHSKVIGVNTMEAINTPLAQSSQAFMHDKPQSAPYQHQATQPKFVQGQPAMAR